MLGKIALEEHFGAPEGPASPPPPDALAEAMFERAERLLRLWR